MDDVNNLGVKTYLIEQWYEDSSQSYSNTLKIETNEQTILPGTLEETVSKIKCENETNILSGEARQSKYRTLFDQYV